MSMKVSVAAASAIMLLIMLLASENMKNGVDMAVQMKRIAIILVKAHARSGYDMCSSSDSDLSCHAKNAGGTTCLRIGGMTSD